MAFLTCYAYTKVIGKLWSRFDVSHEVNGVCKPRICRDPILFASWGIFVRLLTLRFPETNVRSHLHGGPICFVSLALSLSTMLRMSRIYSTNLSQHSPAVHRLPLLVPCSYMSNAEQYPPHTRIGISQLIPNFSPLSNLLHPMSH